MNETDHPRIAHALCLASTTTTSSKAPQVQVATTMAGPVKTANAAFSDVFAGSWALVAPPAAPDVDGSGQVSGACEAMIAEEGDQLSIIGQRDVRWTKFAQDAKPGEAVLLNAYGSRILLGKDAVSITASGSKIGAFLSFDVKGSKVGLSGFPATPGAGAALLSLSTTKAALVSPGGGSSITVSDKGVTITAGGVSINAGKVNLGVGASDPVVTLSCLLAFAQALIQALNLHTHTSSGAGVPLVPFDALPIAGSATVMATP